MEPQTEQTPPKKSLAISTPAAIITAGVFIAIALVFSGRTSTNDTKRVANQAPATTTPAKEISVAPGDYVRGDLSKAEVVIVEYSDSDCPFCERFHATMKDIQKNYGTKVAWVYRHFPLSMHPNAHNEAYALECVAQIGGTEKFWNYLDQLIGITVTPEASKNVLTSTATTLGIDKGAFESCIANPATQKKVADQAAEAQALGAQGTPYSIAISKSGEQVAIPGAYPIDQMKKIIDGLLK